MTEWTAEMTGIMSLLFHVDDVEAADVLAAIRMGLTGEKSKPGDDRSPPYTYQFYFAFDDEGQVTIPADYIMSMLRRAGSSIKAGKGPTTLRAITQTGIVPAAVHCPFVGPNGPVIKQSLIDVQGLDFRGQCVAVEKMGFSLFCKRVTVGRSKHVRVRPRFKTWHVEFAFSVTDERLEADGRLQRLFDEAGMFHGLGDWRPNARTPGSYGRFTTKLISRSGARKTSPKK